jgi:hypothetical protein
MASAKKITLQQNRSSAESVLLLPSKWQSRIASILVRAVNTGKLQHNPSL